LGPAGQVGFGLFRCRWAGVVSVVQARIVQAGQDGFVFVRLRWAGVASSVEEWQGSYGAFRLSRG
jgi:hypothetical protein